MTVGRLRAKRLALRLRRGRSSCDGRARAPALRGEAAASGLAAIAHVRIRARLEPPQRPPRARWIEISWLTPSALISRYACDDASGPLPLLRLRPRGHQLWPMSRLRTRVRSRNSRDLRIASTWFAGAARHLARIRPRCSSLRDAAMVAGVALRRLASRGLPFDPRGRGGPRRDRSAHGGSQPILDRTCSAAARRHALRLGGALLREREVLPRLAGEPRSAGRSVRGHWTARRHCLPAGSRGACSSAWSS